MILALVLFIKAAHLFDGTTETFKRDVVLRIEGDRIAAVGALSIPPGAQVLELPWVLPGLIDCHVHLQSRADHYEEIWAFKESMPSHSMVAVEHARRTLMAGFTSVRDLGSLPFVSVDLKRLIDEGYIPGPRIVASGPGISITGGHGDLNNYAPNVLTQLFPSEHGFKIADGADQIRHVVRAQVKY